MKYTTLILLSLVTSAVLAESSKPITKEERREKVKMVLGGNIARPGTPSGCVTFVNVQSSLPVTNIDMVAENFRVQTGFTIKTVSERLDSPISLKEKVKTGIIVVVMEDDHSPAMLVAPEEGWAQVNVSKLRNNLPAGVLGKVVFAARCRKELTRAFSIVCGGFGSSYKGNVLAGATVEQLDSLREEVPYDVILQYKPYLLSFGIKPLEEVSYRKACLEGWAPAPTNKYQKAVWDRIHALPTAPLKILPETKPVKE